MYKKITLAIGSLSAIAAPAAMAISCGGSKDGEVSTLNWAQKAKDGFKLEVTYGSRWEKEIYDKSDQKIDNPVWKKIEPNNNYSHVYSLVFDLKQDAVSGKWYATNAGAKIYEDDFKKTLWVGKLDTRRWLYNNTEKQAIEDAIKYNQNNRSHGVVLGAHKVSSISYIKGTN